MSLNDSLRRYREDAFTDEDVTRCTGLSVRAWRELIKVGAVRTITEGRGPGRVRLCDSKTFKRAAMIAAFNRAGFNLAVSGKMAYFLPLDDLLYTLWDPGQILLEQWKGADPETGLPPFIDKPKTDWFDPSKPAKADPKNDWLVEAYEGKFVGILYRRRETPMIYGELRNEGATFVSWYPFHNERSVSSATDEITEALLPYKVGDPYAKWEHPADFQDRLNPDFLEYEYEDHGADDDPLRIESKRVANSPVHKTTVNITLAIRKALRRYLGLDGPENADG